MFRNTSAKCGLGWQDTLKGHLRKKWLMKYLILFNLHRKKQISQKVLRGNAINKTSGKKKLKKGESNRKKIIVQCFHSLFAVIY